MSTVESTRSAKRVRPFVKWVGGKSRLIPRFNAQSLLPENFNTYYEPFLGGGAMFFHLAPSYATLNDVNPRLISVYEVIRDQTDSLIDVLTVLEKKYRAIPTESRKDFFLDIRKRFNARNSLPIEQASYLLFLNKTAFNGMYRENSRGEYNVPFGSYVQPKICDEDNIRQTANLLSKVNLLSGSYEDAVRDAGYGDYVYLDPPYHPLNATSSFTSYSQDGFTVKDQENLRKVFGELDKRGAKVMMSNSDTPFIRDLYSDFRQEKVSAGRSINSKGLQRGNILELVVLNY